ncbi:hypothetical protein GGI15_003025 [Coemansia interrupta]|uniref:GSKIP domain-containing protein n=1 Tax=Coemansia interrupta TaxID=1126814 RepID=A0A9W8HEH7_9FUNG|nr:hypothetical protein GGI15_003025 [Coemansia interrupta]
MCSSLLTSGQGLCAELRAELQSHAYGIKAFTPPAELACDGCQCAASTVRLLDADGSLEVGVVLRPDTGYTVVAAPAPALDGLVSTCFESLTALLRAASPAFASAMHRSLSARLLALGASQDG